MTNYENIPVEMKRLNQWVCTQGVKKLPMKAWTYEAASSTSPETWSTFDAALGAVSNGFYDYCGFVFADNGLVGIDIDTGYDEYGFMTPLATDIIARCGSYTEKSKSGRGFHIILKGDLPFKGKNNLAGVEIYKSARYFIMTGDTMGDYPIVENQEAIDYIVATYFGSEKESKSQKVSNRIYTPCWDEPRGKKLKVRPVYPRIPNGSRNICLTSLAGMMHNIGYSKKHILDELKYANRVACDPPLDMNEIHSIVNSVTRYKR